MRGFDGGSGVMGRLFLFGIWFFGWFGFRSRRSLGGGGGKRLFLPDVLSRRVNGFDEGNEPFIKRTTFNGDKGEANTKKKNGDF